MQVTDRESLFYLALPAALLAKPRTDASEGCRQGKLICNYLCGFPVVAGSDLRDEIGDVEPGRASGFAGADAITGMIGEQQFEGGLARRTHFLGVRDHFHAFGCRCSARGPKVRSAFDLHRAQEAGGRWLEALDVAERRNGKAQFARRAEDRGAGGDGDGAAVNGNGDGGAHCGAKAEVRSPKSEVRRKIEVRSPKAAKRMILARRGGAIVAISSKCCRR